MAHKFTGFRNQLFVAGDTVRADHHEHRQRSIRQRRKVLRESHGLAEERALLLEWCHIDLGLCDLVKCLFLKEAAKKTDQRFPGRVFLVMWLDEIGVAQVQLGLLATQLFPWVETQMNLALDELDGRKGGLVGKHDGRLMVRIASQQT